MSNAEAKKIAEQLIRDHAQDVEFITLSEEYDLDDEDAGVVMDLIESAKVEVSW